MMASSNFTWALQLAVRYQVKGNISYDVADNPAAKLDLFLPRDRTAHKPTLMFMHGGGWAEGYTKEMFALFFLPFLQLGWIVANVDYRHAGIARAPVAVADCLRALRWIGENADAYLMDLKQLVIAGVSAGGHLALSTGMIPAWSDPTSAGPAMQAPSLPDHLSISRMMALPRPAAIISWCGVSDVRNLIAGENARTFAREWVGDEANALDVARAVSPLTYVRAGLPPILSVHGEEDAEVPYSQAVRLHEALSRVGCEHELITLAGGQHRFTVDEHTYAYPQILQFLSRAGVCVDADSLGGGIPISPS